MKNIPVMLSLDKLKKNYEMQVTLPYLGYLVREIYK